MKNPKKENTKSQVLIAALSWAVTALIGMLGVNAAATIWYYMEPAAGSVPTPDSYYIAAYCGLAALSLSFSISLVVSIHVARRAGIAARRKRAESGNNEAQQA